MAAVPITARTAFKQVRAERRQRPPRTPLTVRAARFAARHLPSWRAARTFVLSVAGFGLFTAAAWMVAVPFGLAVGGLSLFALEYLSGGDR